MTIAEIHGKISESGTNLSERMEDLLTSDIFGCMRYLPPQKALIPFLLTVTSFHGNILTIPSKVIRVYYSFWQRLSLSGRNPCEPEEGHVHLILVEAACRFPRRDLCGVISDNSPIGEQNTK